MRFQSPTREGCWLQSCSVHPNDERSRRCLVTKPNGAHTQQLLHKNDEVGQNFVSGHNLLEQTLLNACATCKLFDGP